MHYLSRNFPKFRVMGPFIGIFLHVVGGFAAGRFYIPMNIVKKWSWESARIVPGFAAWILIPFIIALLTVPDIMDVLPETTRSMRHWTYFWSVG